MSQSPSWYGILLDAAQRRGIDTAGLSIDRLGEQHASEVETWVSANLINQKPLSAEELLLWQHIDKTQKRHHDKGDVPGRARPPYDEDFYHDAIQDLEHSTHQLQLRSRAIRGQIQLGANVDVPADGGLARIFEAKMERQQEVEMQHILFMNHESEATLQERLQLNQEKVDKCIRAVKPAVREKLRTDDRILESLDKAPLRVSSNPAAESHTRPLLVALRQALVLNLKTRLDRIYFGELRAHGSHLVTSVSADEVKQTQNDLQSLYAEIEDIISMLVETAHGARLMTIEQELKVLASEDTARHAKQTIEQLKSLTQSANRLAVRYQSLQAHRTACEEIDKTRSQLQDRNRDGAAKAYDKGKESASQDLELTALLRHLNIELDETAHYKGLPVQLQKTSASLADGGQKVVKHIVESIQNSIGESQGRLSSLLNMSDDNLCHAAQRNKDFDDQTAATKARLEGMYDILPKTTSFRQRLVDGSYLI